MVSRMREKIMVIDDDEKITSMLRRSLSFEGYTVATAANGQEGLKGILDNEPELVILDVMMPYIDGWEVCRRIRASGTDIPILCLQPRMRLAIV
jgi:two-component system, OmpR family, response regulator MprA